MRWMIGIMAGFLGLVPLAAAAQVKMEGQFTATKACPALTSIKKGSDAYQLRLTVGESYELMGKNNNDASYYWIKMPQATPDMRWVAIACGTVSQPTDSGGKTPGLKAGTTTTLNVPPVAPATQFDEEAKGKSTTPVTPAKTKAKGGGNGFYILSLSWQPAFCEFMPGKLECRKQTPNSYSASHLSLHGLWVQPERTAYCGVDQSDITLDNQRDWRSLPTPHLSAKTRAGLERVMPGTRSYLDRHEWIKHGTCYPGGDAETYFADSVRLMDQINNSAVQQLLASRIGQEVKTSEIKASFDQAFGAGAGDRIRVACKMDGTRQIIAEITVGLKGDISSGTAIGDLMRASSPTKSGCPGGIVDEVGLR